MENISETNNMLQSLSRDLANVVEQAGAAVVAVNARRHLSSSGVYWRDGVIVTAAHTVRRTEDISVVLSSGETLAATLAGADSSTDLAVLKIDKTKLSAPLFRRHFAAKGRSYCSGRRSWYAEGPKRDPRYSRAF